MNKKFLHSALATLLLLIFVTPPLRGWGQTRDEVTDVLTQGLTGVSGTNYSEWSGKKSNSDAVWAGQSAGGNESIQLRSNNSNSGIITTTSGGKVTKVVVTWNSNTTNGRTLNVYGKNTAYIAATDLYNSSNQGTLIGTIVCGTSTELTIGDDYAYIGMRSASGAMYLSQINVTWEVGGGSSTEVATTTTINASNITNTDVYTSTEAGSLTATVTETESGNPVSGATVTWTSSDEDVATIAANGVVTLVAAGTTTITASYAGVSGEFGASSATYELTVTSSAPYVQPTEFEIGLNNALFGTTYGGSVSGITDENPIVGTQDNVTVTYAGGGNHYVNDNQIRFYPSNKLTFEAPEGYEIKEIVFTSAGTWTATITADGGTYDSDTKTWTGSATSVLFTGSVSGRCDMSKASITLGLPSSVATPTFNPVEGTYTSTQNVTISTTTDGATIYYTTDGTNPTTSSAEYTAAIPVNATITIKAIAVLGSDVSSVASATYTILPIEHAGTQADPYTVADARNAIDVYTTVSDAYVTGIISQVDSYNSTYHSITYWISDDGTTTNQLQVYSGKGLEGADFSSVNDVVVGATVVVKGNLKKYNSTYEFDVDSQLVGYTAPTNPSVTPSSFLIEATANTGLSGTLTVTYANITTVVADVWFCNAAGTEAATYSWIVTNVNADNNVEYLIEENTGAARTAYFKVWAYDDGMNEVYSDLVTVTQAAPVVDYATLPFEFINKGRSDIESTAGLTQSGLGTDYSDVDSKLKFNNDDVNLVLKLDAAPKAITFNIKGNSFSEGIFTVQTSEDGTTYTDLATYTENEITNSNQTFTLLNTNDDVRYVRWYFTDKVTGNVGMGNIYVDDEYLVRGMATVSEDLTLIACEIRSEGKLTIESGTLNVTNALTNEATSEAWNNLVIKDGAQLKTPNAVKGTIEKFVAGYGESTNGNYVLLATPATLDACNNTGMWTNTAAQHAEVDFYAFDQSFASKEWRNFKYGNTSFAGPLAMTQGTGYLYANKNDVTLTLETRGYVSPNVDWQDHPFAPTNVDQSVTLEYSDGKPFAGYNLIGNPFTCDAYINRDYYRMNAAGDAIVPAVSATTAIKPCEGIFVVAANTSDNAVTFTTTVPSTSSAPANVVINLKDSEMVRDRAIVSFDGERDMPRFQFNDAAAKLYIPQGEKEMAKVSSEAQGEMPVNFKADKNGSFTLNVDAANLDVDYLHLIDNLTGADVDLLQTPSYTFDARTTDYASRFRLVFSINNVPENEDSHSAFAYFNGSEWVINASNNATVQVVDVMGRVILNADAKHGVSTANMPAGVYMLRLVNGNNVKVQKIVVR